MELHHAKSAAEETNSFHTLRAVISLGLAVVWRWQIDESRVAYAQLGIGSRLH